MAAKKEKATLRGGKLLKKAIEAGKATGVLSEPEPLASSLVRKLKLPDGEAISPAMKELLLADNRWLGLEYDEDEAEIEAMALDEFVDESFGEAAMGAFSEAYELLAEDCVAFTGDFDPPACLYVGTADDAGEYPVLTLSWQDGVARVGGFVPFDVWAAQQLGGLERGKDIGDVPPEYAGLPGALATTNGDGRVVFVPKAGAVAGSDEGDD